MTTLGQILVNGMAGILSGLISGLVVGLFVYLLEERRGLRERRREDYRVATNWDFEKGKPSLRNFDLFGANLSGHKLIGADLE